MYEVIRVAWEEGCNGMQLITEGPSKSLIFNQVHQSLRHTLYRMEMPSSGYRGLIR